MSKEDKREGILPPRDQKRLDQDPERKPKAKKNTRLWCKGKVGREHVTEMAMRPIWGKAECGVSSWLPGRWFCYHAEVCKNCGKQVRWSVGAQCPDRPARPNG